MEEKKEKEEIKIENQENKENKENIENNDNQENKENKDNQENQENKVNKDNKDNKTNNENKKIITSFEYKTDIVQESDVNIILSEDKNSIIFMSLELLISELKDNNLGKLNKNINYDDILIYLVYQKNALMTTEIFFKIIESLLKGNNIETGLILLNTYLTNYYSTEIVEKKETMDKVINLYKLSNRKIITFKISFDEDKKIEIEKLIEYIKSGNKEIINSLGGMEYIRNSLEPRETIIPENKCEIFDIFSWDPIEIARQITLFTQYLYRNIGCQELLLGGWTKSDKMEKSPNVSQLIIRFNKISKWIMEEILSYDSSKDRAKVIQIFITVAEELRKMHNLNDCFAVITTFNHLSIKRLKRTWKNVSAEAKNTQNELSKLCSILKNFENIKNEFLEYRNNVKDINSISEGCIPYLAPYLKDLAFLEEGQKYFNEKKLININKIIIVGRIIKNIKESQMFVYGYKPVYSLAILSDPDPLDDDKLTSLSESIEPKFKLDNKSKNKRKTNSDLIMEQNKSGLTELFVEFIKNYGVAQSNKMTIRDRIKLIKEIYVPINSVDGSYPVERSLDMSVISYSSRASSMSSYSENNNIIKKDSIFE